MAPRCFGPSSEKASETNHASHRLRRIIGAAAAARAQGLHRQVPPRLSLGMGKRVTLKQLGLKKTPHGYGVFVQQEKARLSARPPRPRRRLTFKQPVKWQPWRTAERWKQLGPNGQAPFKATAARRLTELRAKRREQAQKRRRGAACDSESGDDGLTAPQPSDLEIGDADLAAPKPSVAGRVVSDAGLTAPQPEIHTGRFLWQDSDDHMPRGITFASSGDVGSDQKFLGQGTHGVVIKCREAQTLEEFAVKITNVKGDSADDMADAFAVVLREYEMLRKCSHPNVACALAHLQNVDLRQVGLLLELADVSLWHFLKRKCKTRCETPTLQGRLAAALQLCRGLAHTHHCNVVHCDVKPANVLLRFGSECAGRMEGSRLMIADYGLSRTQAEAQQGDKANAINSLPYRPPELLRMGTRRVAFGGEVDVWALGATAFDIAAFGNAKGPNIMMAHYFLLEGAARQIDVVVARDMALARLAPDDTLLKRMAAACAATTARRPSVEAAMQDLRHRMTLGAM